MGGSPRRARYALTLASGSCLPSIVLPDIHSEWAVMRYVVTAILICGVAAIVSIVSDTPVSDAPVCEYRHNGSIISETHHDSFGRLHGKATFYDAAGGVVSVTVYRHGEWVSQIEYDVDGTAYVR